MNRNRKFRIASIFLWLAGASFQALGSTAIFTDCHGGSSRVSTRMVGKYFEYTIENVGSDSMSLRAAPDPLFGYFPLIGVLSVDLHDTRFDRDQERQRELAKTPEQLMLVSSFMWIVSERSEKWGKTDAKPMWVALNPGDKAMRRIDVAKALSTMYGFHEMADRLGYVPLKNHPRKMELSVLLEARGCKVLGEPAGLAALVGTIKLPDPCMDGPGPRQCHMPENKETAEAKATWNMSHY